MGSVLGIIHSIVKYCEISDIIQFTVLDSSKKIIFEMVLECSSARDGRSIHLSAPPKKNLLMILELTHRSCGERKTAFFDFDSALARSRWPSLAHCESHFLLYTP